MKYVETDREYSDLMSIVAAAKPQHDNKRLTGLQDLAWALINNWYFVNRIIRKTLPRIQRVKAPWHLLKPINCQRVLAFTALNKCSLKIEQGSVFGYRTKWCRKSTLIRLLMGFMTPVKDMLKSADSIVIGNLYRYGN